MARTSSRLAPGALLVRGATLVLLLASACHTQFRFDDHSIDATAARDTRSDLALDQAAALDGEACGATSCGYVREDCGRASCKLECPHDATCSGECGDSCNADCEERSRCTLGTGPGAQVRCEADAACEIVLGPGSQALCDPGASCTIRCLGTCVANCLAGATCALACGATPVPQRFTVSGSCT